MKTITVKLAGQDVTINELPAKANAEWREKLEAKLKGYGQIVKTLETFEFETAEDIEALVVKLTTSVNGAMADACTLLLDYCPHLQDQRAQIEAEIRDSEVVEAFPDVLGLAYPFASLLGKVRGLMSNGLSAA